MQKKSNAELRAVVDEKEWTFIQTFDLIPMAGQIISRVLPLV